MSQQNPSPLQKCTGLVMAMQPQFEAVAFDSRIRFDREAEFAIQHLQGNSYTMEAALNNPVALQNAVVNVSALGISLNPAKKHAYLVPRRIDGKKSVCLDISYQGMIHIATDSGAIEWAQARAVYEDDVYENTGLETLPLHRYNPFGGRNRSAREGCVGVYVSVKLPGGSYLTEEMDIAAILDVMGRSESAKSGKSSPWKTDFIEMAKKTVVRRGHKYWPKNDRIQQLVDHLDRNGDGMDFSADPAASAMSDQAMELMGRAEEIAKATESEAMAAPWKQLADEIRKLVMTGQLDQSVFATCRDIITRRVEELKKSDDARTIDA